MFTTNEPVILASASPRRKQMLTRLGIVFATVSADIDESPLQEEAPETFAGRMATGKATAVADKHPGHWVIGADTVITLDGSAIIGKPADQKEAFSILRHLSGKTHQVISGYCLCSPDKHIVASRTATTEVSFIDASDNLLHAYIATGEPMDKAGAYGIQGIGSVLIRKINGSCSNVIGLPLNKIISLLVSHRVISPG